MGFLERIDRSRALMMTTSNVSQWWGTVHEPFTGAWQQNASLDTQDTLLKFPAVFRCITGISSDIAKMAPVKLQAIDGDGIWNDVDNSPYLNVLLKPNHYQIPYAFIESWIVSQLC